MVGKARFEKETKHLSKKQLSPLWSSQRHISHILFVIEKRELELGNLFDFSFHFNNAKSPIIEVCAEISEIKNCLLQLHPHGTTKAKPIVLNEELIDPIKFNLCCPLYAKNALRQKIREICQHPLPLTDAEIARL